MKNNSTNGKSIKVDPDASKFDILPKGISVTGPGGEALSPIAPGETATLRVKLTADNTADGTGKFEGKLVYTDAIIRTDEGRDGMRPRNYVVRAEAGEGQADATGPRLDVRDGVLPCVTDQSGREGVCSDQTILDGLGDDLRPVIDRAGGRLPERVGHSAHSATRVPAGTGVSGVGGTLAVDPPAMSTWQRH